MPDFSASDATLPSVVASLDMAHAETQLVATIIFHPKPSRWGQYTRVCSAADVSDLHWTLGRVGPLFSHSDSDTDIDSGSSTTPSPTSQASMLNDPCISRHAFSLDDNGAGLRLSVPDGGCRVRVEGRDVAGQCDIDLLSLEHGVSIAVAHTVILLLHWRELTPNRGGEETFGSFNLLGCSSYVDQLRRNVMQAAATDCDVLILGESGTGKELVANAVHRGSARSPNPMVAVNMAALTSSLSAAQLFGAAKGAYTGAASSSRGYFQRAQRGTLFLDEVGETPLEIQPQLLRALQEREIQPVGGNIESIDVRILSATDANLDAEECNFNAALKHRLGALAIELEPLRLHREDVGVLVRHFFGTVSREMDKHNILTTVAKDSLSLARWSELFLLLLHYNWPGNVRELSNVIRQLVVSSTEDLVVSVSVLQKLRQNTSAGNSAVEESGQSTASAAIAMDAISDERFAHALDRNSYEVASVARDLGVSRQSVYRRISLSRDFRLASDVPLNELLGVLEACRGDLEKTADQLRISGKALRGRLRQLPSDSLPTFLS
ncbi:MAG: sigma 54-interacting transcriptional regulator [Halioglobus sp.]